jgi:hypothetical protein
MTTHPTTRPSAGALLRSRWPSALGLMMVVASSFRGADVYVVTLLTMLAALIYLSAAATAHRRAAWITFAITSVAVPLGVFTRWDLSLPIVIVAVLLTGYGLLTLPSRGRRELALQAAGFAAFALVAILALRVGAEIAANVAAAGVIGHGVWDIAHHRRDRVVSRAYAEFCAVLDFGMGALLLIVTLLW